MSRTIRLLLPLLIGVCFSGCDANLTTQQSSSKSSARTVTASIPASAKVVPVSIPAQPPAAQPGDTIKICSFNIQVFGTSKLKKPQAMDVLTKVVRRFDVVAIQEVRSTDDTVVPQFVQMINADGSRYDFIIGPRLGRTNSKEQYAVLFNTARIEVDRGSIYTVDDPKDLLHREPMVARFRVRGVQQPFTFNLVDIHTDPDETATELDALADVFVGVQRNGSGEDDVILLGDLNVDEYHLGRLGQLPGITHAITGTTTNTRHDKMYDNIVFDRRATAEFTGRWGVLDLQKEFGLTQQAALEVSDHCPVWAEFSAYEGGAGSVIAGRPQPAGR
jgi:endonuclease/exonuclease/phosphatase family metal-dependent hydrolase